MPINYKDLETDLIQNSINKANDLKEIDNIFKETDFTKSDTIDNVSYQYIGEVLTAQFSIDKDTLSFNAFITSTEDDRFNLELKGGITEIMEGITKFLGSFNDYLNF